MSETPRARGGVLSGPSTEGLVPMMIRGGLVSFDGERGPWMRIFTPEEVQAFADKALAHLAYQKARAEYFRYAPEIEFDPEGVQRLKDAMHAARDALKLLE